MPNVFRVNEQDYILYTTHNTIWIYLVGLEDKKNRMRY